MHHGSCLCGAITFTVKGDLPTPNACHCSQCRKQSGHYWASTDVDAQLLSLTGEENLTWYQSSAKARRGFCRVCGSSLFWDPLEHDTIAIAMGAIASPTGAQLGSHIFVADKGDYYQITDGLPQNQQ